MKAASFASGASQGRQGLPVRISNGHLKGKIIMLTNIKTVVLVDDMEQS